MILFPVVKNNIYLISKYTKYQIPIILFMSKLIFNF
jgi:hypothetical protein